MRACLCVLACNDCMSICMCQLCAYSYICTYIFHHLQIECEEPKVEVSVTTSFPKLGNRISRLESDVRTIKLNTEKAIELILESTEQLGRAFETLSDQMEKVYSQSFQVDDDSQVKL